MSATRDQIINFLLQQDDSKDRVIADLQKTNTELQKKLSDFQPKDVGNKNGG